MVWIGLPRMGWLKNDWMNLKEHNKNTNVCLFGKSERELFVLFV